MLIKAKQLGHDSLVLVYQIKGNPSKLTFYDLEANEKLALLVSVNTTNERLHISPKDLKIRSTVRELDVLAEVLGIEVTTEPQDSNYIRISYADYDDDEYINEQKKSNKSSFDLSRADNSKSPTLNISQGRGI